MPLEKKELDEKIVLTKAVRISEQSISEAFRTLNLNWITPDNALQCYNEILKYALIVKDIAEWEKNPEKFTNQR